VIAGSSAGVYLLDKLILIGGKESVEGFTACSNHVSAALHRLFQGANTLSVAHGTNASLKNITNRHQPISFLS